MKKDRIIILIVLITVVLLVGLFSFRPDPEQPAFKIKHNQTRINWTDDGIGITIRRSYEPPSDGGTGTPAASPISIPPK